MSFKLQKYNPVYQETPLSEIPSIAHKVNTAFRSHKTIPLSYRKGQLRNLYYAIYDNRDIFEEALKKDLNKSKYEVDMTEVFYALGEILYYINHLDELAAPKPSPEKHISTIMSTAEIHKHPLGSALVISPWNYPFILSITPIAAAIAAGNTVVLKPSEFSPLVATALSRVLKSALDPEIFDVVIGGIPQSTALLKEKWDKIMYTGNGTVGRIIARAAAETLTPVILELGGKSPVIVTKNADLRTAARRILFGKMLNAGQTCVAPDYVLVDQAIHDEFLREISKAYVAFGWSDSDQDKQSSEEEAELHEDFGRIINDGHFKRLKGHIDSTQGKVVLGGGMDPKTRYIAPTIVDGISSGDSLMKEELFGPVLGLIEYGTLEQAVEFIVREHDTPLAMYIFSTDKEEQQYILDRVRSGGVSINETMMQFNVNGPFGGVGESGTGSYHGYAGFDAFSHARCVLKQPTAALIEKILDVRYRPYTTSKSKQMSRLSGPSSKPVGVPRSGNVVGSYWGFARGSPIGWLLGALYRTVGYMAVFVIGFIIARYSR